MDKITIRNLKKDIKIGFIPYLKKNVPGKAKSTYDTFISDSYYLLNNEQEDAYLRFMRSSEEMPEVKAIIKEILIENRGEAKDLEYYYEKLCWQREYVHSIGGIDTLLK